MLISYKRGQGSIVLRVKILNSSVTTGAGLTGLTFESAGLIIGTIADNEATSTAYTQAGSTIETISTLGTYAAPTATKCRFKEVDATNHPGVYEIQLADARYAVSNAKSLIVSISGATNCAETDCMVPLRDLDPYDSVRGGMTALPAAAADAAGGLPISDAGGLDLDTKLASTNEVTAARMGALTDWIDGGRLDLLLDAIPTTAMRGTDSAATAAKLQAYVQLLARSDAAIASDKSTELGEINANEGSGAGNYANTDDSQEAIRDRGDSAWITATSVTVSDKTGFSLANSSITTATFGAGAINAAAIADAAIDNATFAADVGSTAYASNIIALAVRKVLDELNLDHWMKMPVSDKTNLGADGGSEVVEDTVLALVLSSDGDSDGYDYTTDSMEAIRENMQQAVEDSIVDHGLDHFCKTATAGADMTNEVADGTIVSRIIANGDTSAFTPSTDGLQPIRDHGDAAWTTAAALDAAGVRAAIGLSSADLDTQLSAISGYVDCLPASWVTVPTAAAIADAVWDELSTGHTGAGKAGAQLWTDIDAILVDTRTDGVVVASASKTGYALTSAYDAAKTAAAAGDAMALTSGERTSVADAILVRAVSNIEDSADKHSLGAVVMLVTNSSISGTTWTAKKPSDDSTFNTYTVVPDDDASPITGVS